MSKHLVVILAVDRTSYVNVVNMSDDEAVALEDALEHDERIMWSTVGGVDPKPISHTELRKDLQKHFGLDI